MLNTLRFAGLVTRDDQTKRYRLGLNLLVLSRALINQTDLARETIPYLEELAAETGSAVHLGVISGDMVYVMARRQAPGCMYTPYDVGTRYPVTFGAHGRAILASLSLEDFETAAGARVHPPAGSDRPRRHRPGCPSRAGGGCSEAGLRAEPRDNVDRNERGECRACRRINRHAWEPARSRMSVCRRQVLGGTGSRDRPTHARDGFRNESNARPVAAGHECVLSPWAPVGSLGT